MNDLHVLCHLARADFLERVRRYSFLVTLILIVAVTYLYLPALDTPAWFYLNLGGPLPIYNWAWIGLAVAVQAYSGGIRLDTIFIDEGLSSLDSDKLDRAIQTLEDLKEGGRLVAIISHVDSLRERVPARLEVSIGLHGSTARFVLT